MVLAIVALAIALMTLFPLKTIVPIRVEVDPRTGEMSEKGELNAFTPDDANKRYWLGQVVLNAERVEKATLERTVERALQLMSGPAIEQYKAFLNETRPFDAVKADANLLKTPTLIGPPTFLGSDAVLVRVRVDNLASPKPEFYRWAMRFQIVPPKDRNTVMINPAGLYVTHFERTAE